MVDPRRHLFHFDPERVTLPKDTRVVLKTDLIAEDGYRCKASTVGGVVELAYDKYVMRTASGRRVDSQRDQLAIQRHEHLPAIARRQHAWETLRERLIHAAVEEKATTEKGLIEDDARYLALLPELWRRLALARDRSRLPEEPAERAALDAWLRRWRVAAGALAAAEEG